MANKNLPFSINLNEIPKELIKSVDKDGQPFKNNGEFVNLRMFINEKSDEFGNNIKIVMNQPKSENSEFIFVGNGKVDIENISLRQLNFNINLNEIPKELIKSVDKDGQPFKNNGEFVNLRMFINEKSDEFGNNIKIVMNQPKSENSEFIFVGNGKVDLTDKID